jgi:hypothetical protein
MKRETAGYRILCGKKITKCPSRKLISVIKKNVAQKLSSAGLMLDVAAQNDISKCKITAYKLRGSYDYIYMHACGQNFDESIVCFVRQKQ